MLLPVCYFFTFVVLLKKPTVPPKAPIYKRFNTPKSAQDLVDRAAITWAHIGRRLPVVAHGGSTLNVSEDGGRGGCHYGERRHRLERLAIVLSHLLERGGVLRRWGFDALACLFLRGTTWPFRRWKGSIEKMCALDAARSWPLRTLRGWHALPMRERRALSQV